MFNYKIFKKTLKPSLRKIDREYGVETVKRYDDCNDTIEGWIKNETK